MSILTYRGQNIEQRQADGYVNLTQMAKANNTRLDKWQESPETQKYLKALQNTVSPDSGVSMIQINSIGFPAVKTTWGHPLAAIAFGQWISPEFHVWCNVHIKTLMETGSTAIAEQTKLPQRDAVAYIEAAKTVETVTNLTLRELLRDELIDELSVKRGIKQLAAAPKEYTIAKVRARELGYSTAEIGNGSALGRFVAKLVPIAFEERVGKYNVKHYEVNDQLDTAIKSYFGMKHALK